VRLISVVAGLAVAMASFNSLADDLTAAQAETLLQPYMSNDCGSYYTTQGEPDFADLEDKQMCVYQPRVTRITVSGNTASADYNKDRHFIEAMSLAWLKDYARMESHQTPSLLFKALKTHLDKWRADSGGVDRADRFGSASFKLENGAWKVDSAPQ